MPPHDKPYKILVRSPKGCIFDKLLCVKCCDTITRGNYTAHKRTEKHAKLHEGGSIEQEDPEIYKNRQIEKVMNYHENRNKGILEGGYIKYNGKRYTEEQYEALKAKTKARDIENRHTEISQTKPITTREELKRAMRTQPEYERIPLIDKYDDDQYNTVNTLYNVAKNIYKRLDPQNLESKKRVGYDIEVFKKIFNGEIYENTPKINAMFNYYANLY